MIKLDALTIRPKSVTILISKPGIKFQLLVVGG